MLGMIFTVWAIGCFTTAVCMIVSHCTLGKTDSYYRCDSNHFETMLVVLLSWFSTYFYIKDFICNFRHKPKDFCKKG